MSDDETRGPLLFDLTEITGARRNENRTAVIGKLEVSRGLIRHAAIGMLVGILPVMVLMPLIKLEWSLVLWFAIAGGWTALFHTRTRKGLGTTTAEALWDRRNAKNRRFYQCMIEITDDWHNPVIVAQRTRPARRDIAEPDFFGLDEPRDTTATARYRGDAW